MAPEQGWQSAIALAERLRSLSEPDPVPARRQWSRRARLVTGAVPATLAGGILLLRGTQATTVRVSDATGDGAGRLGRPATDAGWNPATLRLPAGHAPGLIVAPDLSAWSNPGDPVPGVFVGASRALGTGGPAPSLPDHAGCVRVADRSIMVDGVPAQVHRWIRCGGTAIAYDEVLVRRTAAWVRRVRADKTGGRPGPYRRDPGRPADRQIAGAQAAGVHPLGNRSYS